MATISELIAGLSAKGAEFIETERNRQRAAYIASRNAAKLSDWSEGDDTAFDRIDIAVHAMAHRAGYFAPSETKPETDAAAEKAANWRREQEARHTQERVAAATSDAAVDALAKELGVDGKSTVRPAAPLGGKPAGFA